MYYLLSLISGVLISVMILCNGSLSDWYGVNSATVIIHTTGLLLISLVLLLRREKPFAKKMKWYLYLGGAIGVATVMFNNLAFGRISISAILALSLLGQSVTSIIVDQFGLMNMPKYPLKKGKIIGLIIIAYGITFMISEMEIVAVILSFASGISLVVSRTLNARLAEGTNANISTFFNYLIGLVFAVPILIFFGQNEPLLTQPMLSTSIYIYLGGIIGVIVVFLSNLIVTKISSFYMTLFIFISQIFSGVILDITFGDFDKAKLIGGFIVAIGLIANLLIDNSSN